MPAHRFGYPSFLSRALTPRAAIRMQQIATLCNIFSRFVPPFRPESTG